jgi:hypothetical protein
MHYNKKEAHHKKTVMNLTAVFLSIVIVAFLVFVTASMGREAPQVPTEVPHVYGETQAPGEADMVTFAEVAATPLLESSVAPMATPFASGAMDTVDTSQEESARLLGATLLAHHMAQAQEDPIELQCPEEEVPCPQEIVWQNSFPGCGSFHIPFEGKSYFRDERLWQGDLNPKIQERYALMDKGWDPYKHMNARQAWMQFIATNNSSQSDKYMKAIDDLTDVDTTRVTDIEPVPVY